MLTSAAPLPMGSSDPVQPGLKPAVTRFEGGGAAETKSKATPVAPPAEAAKTARLRDKETSETTDRDSQRDLPSLNSPTGPPPAFKETPLERAGRLVFDTSLAERDQAADASASGPRDPVRELTPTPTQRAETDFSFQQSLNLGPPKPTVELTI